LKEKLLAAHRGGIQTVIIPEENARDLVEIPKNIKQNLDIRPVRWIDQVLSIALTRTPVPRPAATEEEKGEAGAKAEPDKAEVRAARKTDLTTH
jgi:ATP-dependent Lon protease